VREDLNGRKHLCKTGWKYFIKLFKKLDEKNN